MKKVFMAVFLFSVVSLLVPGVGNAQCLQLQDDETKALKSNEFFKVLAPNTIRFRPGVDFEIVTSPEGKTFLRYGRNLDAKDPLKALLGGGLSCACDCPEADCEITITESGDARCRGGCYAEGDACISCHWHSEA